MRINKPRGVAVLRNLGLSGQRTSYPLNLLMIVKTVKVTPIKVWYSPHEGNYVFQMLSEFHAYIYVYLDIYYAADKTSCVKESVKDKACESAKEAKKKAAESYEKTGEATDKVEEQVCDMGKKVTEESKKRAAEAEDTLYWAEEKAKEGYEAAKTKAEETYESGKEKLSHHQEL